jgi:hypothetical protein
MNVERIMQTIADLDNMAVYADHTGNKSLGRAMRQASVLLSEMLAEARVHDAKLTERWKDNPSP